MNPAIECAENIALLHLLHPVPVSPTVNALDPSSLLHYGYNLSMDDERGLVSTLAFLSSVKEDSNHIPALCVIQSKNEGLLTVLIAMNRVTWEDGLPALETLKQGFQGIFAILSKVPNGIKSSRLERDLYSAIVSMCSARILSRLGIIPKQRETGKQPFMELLQEVITLLSQSKDQWFGHVPFMAAKFIEKAKEVTKLGAAYANHRVSSRLEDLVEGIYSMQQVGNLRSFMDAIPNKAMQPNSRKSLLNMINKLARYREAARFLHRRARKIPVIRNMRVAVARFPKKGFKRTLVSGYEPSLQSTFSRIGMPKGVDLGYICRLLDTTKEVATDRFAEQTKKTLNEGKIHAEIQLLRHCEKATSNLPPRVVCSSKDACFLCNTFIRMHGKMHTPGSHGRLYPGWRLPHAWVSNETEQRFNHDLQDLVRKSLRDLLSRRKRTMYPYPLESTLLTLPSSVSTLHSLLLNEAVVEADRVALSLAQPDGVAENNGPLSLLDLSHSTPTENTGHIGPSSLPADKEEAEGGQSTGLINKAASRPPSDLWNPRCASLSSTINEDMELLPGLSVSASIECGQKSRIYTSGPIEVQIEAAAELCSMTAHSTSMKFNHRVKMLTIEEAEELKMNHASSIVDVGALEGEVVHGLDSLNGLYLAARGSVVHMQFSTTPATDPRQVKCTAACSF